MLLSTLVLSQLDYVNFNTLNGTSNYHQAILKSSDSAARVAYKNQKEMMLKHAYIN